VHEKYMVSRIPEMAYAQVNLCQRRFMNDPRSGPPAETPIEKIFRRLMKREMTNEKRRYFHLKIIPRDRTHFN
jgi:hypothetical protein